MAVENIQPVDEDHILQRLQGLEVKSYRYTEQWAQVRGIQNKYVRGVIAQQTKATFPEYVNVIDQYVVPADNRKSEPGSDEGTPGPGDFMLEQFHEVNKQAITIDLLAAVQAQHRRFHVGPNSPTASGDVTISSASAGDFAVSDPAGSASGSISLRSGHASIGDSGSVTLGTGDASGPRNPHPPKLLGGGDVRGWWT